MRAIVKGFLSWLVIAVLAQNPVQAQSEMTCSSLLAQDTFHTLKVSEGSQVQEIEWTWEATNQKVDLSGINAQAAFELGEGGEGTVYRIHPIGGGPSYLLKSYHPGEEAGLPEAVTLLTYWNSLSAALKQPVNLQIAVPRKGPLPNTLIFDDVRGETVRKILSSTIYSRELKIRFTKKLMLALGDFVDAMMEEHSELDLIDCCLSLDDHKFTYSPFLDVVPEFLGLQNAEQSDVHIYFSPNNIIYDMDRDIFVIIDPA